MHRLSDSFLQDLLDEDIPYGDLTTHLLGIGHKAARMTFTARNPMVACCVEEAARLVALSGGEAGTECASGDWREAWTPLLVAEGSAESLLAAWKVAQTLVETASGIATATRRIVEAAERGGGAVVSGTRKSFPHGRAVSLKAVWAGGGVAHRLGLSDSVLVFPEHRVFLDGSPAEAVRRLKAASPERKIAAEVKTEDEAMVLAEAGLDVLQLEKFTVEAVERLRLRLSTLPATPLLAVAGGVNEGNAEAYVRAGAAIIVTSAPYWAKPADVQVTFARA